MVSDERKRLPNSGCFHRLTTKISGGKKPWQPHQDLSPVRFIDLLCRAATDRSQAKGLVPSSQVQVIFILRTRQPSAVRTSSWLYKQGKRHIVNKIDLISTNPEQIALVVAY